MSGQLTQTVKNLLAAEATISSMQGLPAGAVAIQKDSSTTIDSIAKLIQPVKSAIGAYVAQAKSEIAAIELMVAANKPIAEIETAILQVKSQTIGLQDQVNQVFANINPIMKKVLGYNSQISTIKDGLNAQAVALQGQLGTAQSEEDAAKKKYYYLIALGPFGLIGLAAALAVYLNLKSNVDDIENQENALNAQLSVINTLNANCKNLSVNFNSLVTTIGNLKNAVNFVVDDVLEIDQDLSLKLPPSIIDIKLKAAQAEVITLGIDAA